MALYKYVLHHSGNALSKAYLETIGVYVSLLNACPYCIEHHFSGLKRLLGNDERANEIRAALEANQPDTAFADRDLAGLVYVEQLTRQPNNLTMESIDALREAGFDDGEILEINQVAAYFSYANRTVLGLGISTDGDIIGLSPGDNADPDNWSHN